MGTDQTLSAGKIRGLTAASNAAGIFTILAVDHRDSMRVVIDPDDPQGIEPRRLTETKFELMGGVEAVREAAAGSDGSTCATVRP